MFATWSFSFLSPTFRTCALQSEGFYRDLKLILSEGRAVKPGEYYFKLFTVEHSAAGALGVRHDAPPLPPLSPEEEAALKASDEALARGAALLNPGSDDEGDEDGCGETKQPTADQAMLEMPGLDDFSVVVRKEIGARPGGDSSSENDMPPLTELAEASAVEALSVGGRAGPGKGLGGGGMPALQGGAVRQPRVAASQDDSDDDDEMPELHSVPASIGAASIALEVPITADPFAAIGGSSGAAGAAPPTGDGGGGGGGGGGGDDDDDEMPELSGGGDDDDGLPALSSGDDDDDDEMPELSGGYEDIPGLSGGGLGGGGGGGDDDNIMPELEESRLQVPSATAPSTRFMMPDFGIRSSIGASSRMATFSEPTYEPPSYFGKEMVLPTPVADDVDALAMEVRIDSALCRLRHRLG